MSTDNLREYFSFQRRQRIKRSLFKTVHNREIMGTAACATFLYAGQKITHEISLIAQKFLTDSYENNWEKWRCFSWGKNPRNLTSSLEFQKRSSDLPRNQSMSQYKLKHFSLNALISYSRSFYSYLLLCNLEILTFVSVLISPVCF